MHIEFKRLREIDKSKIMDLMNNPLVRGHMPLLKGKFCEEDCDRFITSKEKMWKEHGFGPWAFEINRRFAGWGGVQPDNGEADLALVLHPHYWGAGKILYEQIIDRAFNGLGLKSIQVIFPPTRTHVSGLARLGFVRDCEVEIEGKEFIRFVLIRSD